MDQNKKTIAALSTLLLSLFIAGQVYAASVQRSHFIVGNLSCSSCLASIEAALKGMPGALGMDADLRAGRVTVDHLSTLGYGQIEAAITNLGYPAAMEWTATVPVQSTNKFARQSRYNSGCSSGGCGTSVGTGAGPATWKAAPAAGKISRTTLQVSNLTCTSCLNTIALELSKLPETYGMNGYLSRGVILVDHADGLETSRLAAFISGLGYPARAVASNEIPAQKAFSTTPQRRPSTKTRGSGGGCGSKGPCNATSASWQKLYNRYFSQK